MTASQSPREARLRDIYVLTCDATVESEGWQRNTQRVRRGVEFEWQCWLT